MPKKNLTTGNMALNKYRQMQTTIDNSIDDNYYADLIFDLFATTYLPEYEEVKTWKRHFGKPFQVNIKQYEAIERINKKIDYIRNESPSFDDLFEFATFMKIIEKVFMYKNDKDSPFVCDSNLDDDKHRTLVLQCKDCLIKIKLEKHSDGYPDTIDILVDRLYGKNMKTTYHIENRESNAKDTSDIMLMNNITMLVRESMANILCGIGNIVVNKQINDCFIDGLNLSETTHVCRDDEYYCWGEGKQTWAKDRDWYLKHAYKPSDD